MKRNLLILGAIIGIIANVYYLYTHHQSIKNLEATSEKVDTLVSTLGPEGDLMKKITQIYDSYFMQGGIRITTTSSTPVKYQEFPMAPVKVPVKPYAQLPQKQKRQPTTPSVVTPKSSTPESIGASDVWVLVDLGKQMLFVYRGNRPGENQPIYSAPCSSGKRFTPTPTGLHLQVVEKRKDDRSNRYNAPMPWCLRLGGDKTDQVKDREICIHGSNYRWMDAPLSGGCVRLSDDDAQKVFDLATVGTKVFTVGNIEDYFKDGKHIRPEDLLVFNKDNEAVAFKAAQANASAADIALFKKAVDANFIPLRYDDERGKVSLNPDIVRFGWPFMKREKCLPVSTASRITGKEIYVGEVKILPIKM